MTVTQRAACGGLAEDLTIDQLLALLTSTEEWIVVDNAYTFYTPDGLASGTVLAETLRAIDTRIIPLMDRFAFNNTRLTHLLHYAIDLWADPSRILHLDEAASQGVDVDLLISVHQLDDGLVNVVCEGRRLHLLETGVWFANEHHVQHICGYQIDVTPAWFEKHYAQGNDKLAMGLGIGLSGRDIAKLLQSEHFGDAPLPNLESGQVP